jgi:formamidopyrimidine-DNA glycosylase
MNYCPGCQTGGRILADRALSRLLKKDWPRTLEELERIETSRKGNPPGGSEPPGD